MPHVAGQDKTEERRESEGGRGNGELQGSVVPLSKRKNNAAPTAAAESKRSRKESFFKT